MYLTILCEIEKNEPPEGPLSHKTSVRRTYSEDWVRYWWRLGGHFRLSLIAGWHCNVLLCMFVFLPLVSDALTPARHIVSNHFRAGLHSVMHSTHCTDAKHCTIRCISVQYGSERCMCDDRSGCLAAFASLFTAHCGGEDELQWTARKLGCTGF